MSHHARLLVNIFKWYLSTESWIFANQLYYLFRLKEITEVPWKGICSLSALQCFWSYKSESTMNHKTQNTGEEKAARPGFRLSAFCSTVARREWAHRGQLLPLSPILLGSSSTEQWRGTLRRADLGLQKMETLESHHCYSTGRTRKACCFDHGLS